MFILKCNLCNYANDNTLYSTGKDLRQIRTNLEMDFMILHHWFHENRIKFVLGLAVNFDVLLVLPTV